jgi:predicted CXXCH cytochrome family protein
MKQPLKFTFHYSFFTFNLIVFIIFTPIILIAQEKVPIPAQPGRGQLEKQLLMDPPHWGNGIDCGSCHVVHQSPGAQLNTLAGNANLCISCHNPAGIASSKPFSNSYRAQPGISGTSHAWDAPAINETFGACLPTNPDILSRVMNDSIVCSTCHDQHDQSFPPYLRASNYQNALCKDCHAIRDVGIYWNDPNNKGSHPAGVPYPGSDPRFHSSPQNPNLLLIDPDQVECMTCHGVHYTDSGGANGGLGDGYLLRAANDNTLCEACHTYGAHNGMNCLKCHQPHNPNQDNIFMVRDSVETPNSGILPAIFLNESGANSFADGDSQYDGICEICHTNTNYHRNNASGDHTHNAGINCTDCHSHRNSFQHGGSGGEGCISCHGHDAGTLYDPDASYPYTPGTTASQGNGTYHSHSTHTENDSDDVRGPEIYCDTCHDISNFPYFKSGNDLNGDGKYSLDETDVCDNCHSAGGTYDGINDLDIGGKNNWAEGVYSGSGLNSGKEKWCATCHDQSPANSKADGSGVAAPNIAGDEEGAYIYGSGWGYYKTGHGLPATESYPSSGGITAGADVNCDGCHDFSTKHIDHIARTFDDGNSGTTDPSVYRAGYRLQLVDGQEPMQVPWLGNSPFSPPNSNDSYRLCARCHVPTYPDPSSGPFADPNNWETNLVTTGMDSTKNRHEYHLSLNQARYPSDWSGSNNSRMSCVACHNVHGSTYLTMVRDGKLVNREPGLRIWYNNDNVVIYNVSNPDPPEPQDLPLTASTGTVWIGNSSGNLCSHCHGNANTIPEYRTPFQNVSVAPVLEWVGDFNFEYDGVDPDYASGGTIFLFRVKYIDVNNDPPSTAQLLVDADGDGSPEAITMAGEVGDVNYVNGRIYSAVTPIARPATGPGNVDYRFNFISTDSIAGGDPSEFHQFEVTNNPPVLSWTGNPNYETDGVHPNTGPAGDFNFEILYTDPDGDYPSSITLIIDDVEPGYDMVAGSGNVTSGKIFTRTIPLNQVGEHTYRFAAKDNDVWGNNATGQTGPLTNNTVTVTGTPNHAPMLEYVNDSCFTNSVLPVRGPVEGDYDFRVVYTDLDNEPPTVIKVIVDNTVEYNLTAISGNILTGRIYGTTSQINISGPHTYHFYAHDGQDPATGDPAIVNGNTLSVVDAAKVKKNDSRPGWYGSIQAAINALSDTIIMVYPGTYNENLRFDSSPADDRLTLEAICGPEHTIIEAAGNTVFIQNTTDYTRLNGFTLTGGTYGIYLNNSKAIVENSIIRNNTNRGISSGSSYNSLTISNTVIRDNNENGNYTNGDGAGVYINGGTSHSITNCTIINNRASRNGGGVFVQNVSSGNLITSGTTISNNSANGDGGGIFSNNSNLVITKSTIRSNTTADQGGGLFIQGPSRIIDLSNSIIADNTANEGGGLWINSYVTINITNCTLSRNTTSNTVSGKGGAIYANYIEPTITNCIFWENIAGSNPGSGHNCYALSNSALFTFLYCDLINNSLTLSGNGSFIVGSTNSGSDPQFEDAANGDYHLRAGSPCIDFGTSTGAPVDDIVGQARGIDGRGDGQVTGDLSDYDMGAYEYVP